MTTDQALKKHKKLFDKIDKQLDADGKWDLRDLLELESELTASEEQPDNYLTEKE